MKHLLYTLFIVSTALLLTSCAKQEVFTTPPRIVKVIINGKTLEDIDYIYRDSVVGSSKAGPGGINVTMLLALGGNNDSISIVKRSTSDTLPRRLIIAPAPYEQVMTIYYDGTYMYDSMVPVQLKGYSLSGQLECKLDGKVLYTGTGAVNTTLEIPINKNGPRTVQLFKAGNTTPLLSQAVEPSRSGQKINFFFDGTKIVENIKLTPPSNPANMMITAQFQTVLPQFFTNVDVDLVFYVKNTATSVATKANPEIRFTLPVDGSLRSIELPALPATTGYVYSFDIFEKGTNNVPYNKTVPGFITGTFLFQENAGRYGDFNLEAGTSKLWQIVDKKNLRATAPKGTYMSGIINDLSTYFQ